MSAHAQVTTLASFNGTDGAYPVGDTLVSGDTVYGVTSVGGTNGSGTVYSVPVTGGTPTVLANFPANVDSGAGLVISGNTLYGTLSNGGADGDGAVFSVPVTGGTPTILGSFEGSNGKEPVASLTVGNGVLYGTTFSGGLQNEGVVFSLPMTGGTPNPLFSFGGVRGEHPESPLTLNNGILYGTAAFGGPDTHDDNVSGTIFAEAITGGAPTILASLNGTDGSIPSSNLILSGHLLYGTSYQNGGAANSGTVFSLALTGGTPTTLYSFNGTTDGRFPLGELSLVDGVLYGTTADGGANGEGVLFGVPTAGGSESVLVNFDNLNEVSTGVTASADTLYGTTYGGGTDQPFGGVYSLSVPEPSSWILVLLGMGGIIYLRVRSCQPQRLDRGAAGGRSGSG